jgi:hypothetical protein
MHLDINTWADTDVDFKIQLSIYAPAAGISFRNSTDFLNGYTPLALLQEPDTWNYAEVIK